MSDWLNTGVTAGMRVTTKSHEKPWRVGTIQCVDSAAEITVTHPRGWHKFTIWARSLWRGLRDVCRSHFTEWERPE